MRVIALMACKNEADRYLTESIEHLQEFCDDVFMFDDQSDDDSVAIARSMDVTVEERPECVPSFMQHEGAFRQWGWDALQRRLRPVPGDWVLANDADEFLVAEGDTRAALEDSVAHAAARRAKAVKLPIPEVFSATDRLYVRVDGFWDQITGPRFFVYQLGGAYQDRSMASGAEPTYVKSRPPIRPQGGLALLHLGYSRIDDRRTKYQRYSSTKHHHNSAHIKSILGEPRLVPWLGKIPEPLRPILTDLK